MNLLSLFIQNFNELMSFIQTIELNSLNKDNVYDQSFEISSHNNTIRVNVELIISQTTSFIELSYRYKSIVVNGSEFIYKTHIPFALFLNQINNKPKTFLITRNTHCFNICSFNTMSLIFVMLPFTPILISQKTDLLLKIFGLFDATPVPIHYFDDRRPLLSYKCSLSYNLEHSAYTKYKIHSYISRLHDIDMNSIQFLTFPTIQTIISKISELYYKELGFSYKIINDNPTDELIPENSNHKILIFLPKDELVPSPTIVYGTNIYELVTTLRVENDVLVNTFQYKDYIFDVRDQSVKFEEGNSPFGQYIALEYRLYQKNDICVLNIPSFVLRYEKTKIYRYEVDTKSDTVSYYDINSDETKQIKHSWNYRLSCYEKETDLLLMDTSENVYYFEYDPGRILFSTNPIPSICGKSLLVMENYQPIKKIVWINYPLVSNKDSNHVNFSQFNSNLENQTVVYTNYFVPAIVTKEMYTASQLINELILNSDYIENYVVTNMLNGKIIKRYARDDSINFDFPVVLFQTISINEKNIIPFSFNKKLISDRNYIVNHPNIKNTTETDRFVIIQNQNSHFDYYFLNLKEPTLVSYCLSGISPTLIISLAKYFLLYIFDLKIISRGKQIKNLDPEGLIKIDELQDISEIEIVHKSKQIKIYEISLKIEDPRKTNKEPEITSYFNSSFKKISMQSKYNFLLNKSSKITRIVIPDEINLTFFDCSLISV